MAGKEPLHCQPGTFQSSIFFNSLDAIFRTGGDISAFGSKQGRYKSLVEPDEKNKKASAAPCGNGRFFCIIPGLATQFSLAV
jgi:hypothetical protein